MKACGFWWTQRCQNILNLQTQWTTLESCLSLLFPEFNNCFLYTSFNQIKNKCLCTVAQLKISRVDQSAVQISQEEKGTVTTIQGNIQKYVLKCSTKKLKWSNKNTKAFFYDTFTLILFFKVSISEPSSRHCKSRISLIHWPWSWNC